MDNMNIYGQPTGYYGAGAAMFGQPMYYNAATIAPQNNPSLTAEEMKIIASQNPSKIDISITEADKFRAICNHKDQNKIDRVVQLADGSGDVFCPICNYRWSPENLTKEEVKELCDKLIAAMQNAKWVGDYGVELTRAYFSMIPLLEKFPDLYEYAMKQFNKYCSTNGYASANDAAIYNQYNSLMGYSTPGFNTGYYEASQQPMYGNPSYGMSQPMYGNPSYGMSQPMYGNPYTQAQPATNVNPMQAPCGATPQQPMYGNPYAAMPQTPGVGTPLNNMGVPSYAPAAAQGQPQPANGAVITDNANGTTTSENSVKLS